jgi:uracil-DNA glycosylase family 4
VHSLQGETGATKILNIRREYSRLVKDTIDYIGTGFGTEPEAPTVPPKKKLMTDLTGEILQCTHCELHRGRSRAVPGEGSIDADILFVGEGPGQVEDSTGRPFVGKAGQLLTKMLTAIDLTREEVYITNIVKCRPPGNRNPLPEEIEQCLPYLERQIALIDPLIICCLGGPASSTLLSSGAGISKLRGTIHRYEALTDRRPGDGVPLVATYHPAAVLRFPEKYRRPVWNDLKLLRDYYRDIREKR